MDTTTKQMGRIMLKYIIVLLLLMPFAVAEIQTLGTFKQGQTIQLIQICDNCTYNNISSVLYPNGTTALSNVNMSRSGTSYVYNFNLTDAVGQYIINGFGDLNGVITVWNYNLYVTPMGVESTTAQSIVLAVVFVGILSFALLFFYIGNRLLYNQIYYFAGYILLFFGVIFSILDMFLAISYNRNLGYITGNTGLLETALGGFIGFIGFIIVVGFVLTIAYFLMPKQFKKFFNKFGNKSQDGWDE